MSRSGSLVLCAAMAATVMGCADITMRTVDTQTEVLSRRQHVIAGRSVKVRSRIDGTTLFLQTNQGCDLVEMEDVRVTEIREADEDLTEEFTVLGLATLPLATGIIMLVDAPNVYGDERNSAQYNPVGPEGAYAGGTVLTAVGGIMALVPIIELLRVAAAGEVTTSTSSREGAVISSDVPCSAESRPVRTSVVLRVGARNLSTQGTDHNGYLELDLAKAIPHEVAKKAVSVEVIVAGKVVGELDIGPILDAQIEAQRAEDEAVWQTVESATCRQPGAADSNACASVRSYLNRFPDGAHAQEAAAILEQHDKKSTNVIAEDPEAATDAPPPSEFEGVKNDLERTQRQTCRAACVKNCASKGPGGKAAECVQGCVKEVCQ